MSAPVTNAITAARDGRPVLPFRVRRSRGGSWFTLVGSAALHALVFAVTAHWYNNSASGGADDPSSAPEGEELSISVAVRPQVAKSTRSKTFKQETIRRAQPTQQPILLANTSTDIRLPPPLDSEALPMPAQPLPDIALAATDTPPPPSEKHSPTKSSRPAGRKSGGANPRSGSGAGAGSGPALAPRLVRSRTPAYPSEARRRGHEGVVLVIVQVSESGRVESSRVYRSSGHRELDETAVASVWKWGFAPAVSHGRPVAASAVVRVSFRMEG